METSGKWIRVWDPVVRIGHWSLVAAFFTAYFTEGKPLTAHVWAGYLVAAVVALRLVWGAVGTRHARFGGFVRSPLAGLRYLRDVATGRARRYLGHNPAGAAMIVVLLLSLTCTAASGMVLYAYDKGAGPLAPLLVEQPAAKAPVAAPAAEPGSLQQRVETVKRHHRKSGAGRTWKEIHEFFANFTLFLVIVHVSGVVLSSLAHRENLVRAMFTGRKREA